MKVVLRFALSIPLQLLAVCISSAALAETYDGVLTVESNRPRSIVQSEAVTAAQAPDQNVVLGSRGPLPFKPTATRAGVRMEAVSTARAPDQNVVPGSRVNSRLISTMPGRKLAAETAEASSALQSE